MRIWDTILLGADIASVLWLTIGFPRMLRKQTKEFEDNIKALGDKDLERFKQEIADMRRMY